MENLRQINNYDLEGDYDKIILLKKSQQLPKAMTFKEEKEFIERYELFYLIKGEVYYKNLKVILKKNIEKVLTKLYEDKKIGFGHGITQFYEIVTNRYLNITRKETTAFLKKQTNYQLTFKAKARIQPVKKYDEKHIAYALDLIDIHRYSTVNKNNKFILTLIDVYSSQIWLRPLKNKEAEDVNSVLEKIFKIQKPKYLLMDNGNEFMGINKKMFKDMNIKVIHTPSHTPQPNIEQLNSQIRKFISKLFVENKNFVWVDYLLDIEKNINHYQNLPRNILKREKSAEKRNETKQILVKPKFKINDVVRILQSVSEPHIREENKKGNQKYMHVKYSVDLFIVVNTYKPYKANSITYYTLKYKSDNEIVKENNKVVRFKEKDILLVPEGSKGEVITHAENNKLNGIRGYTNIPQPVKRITRSMNAKK